VGEEGKEEKGREREEVWKRTEKSGKGRGGKGRGQTPKYFGLELPLYLPRIHVVERNDELCDAKQAQTEAHSTQFCWARFVDVNGA